MKCRNCGTSLEHVFCDLQTCPPSNAMVKKENSNLKEIYFPLKAFVCHDCWLVQVDEVEKAEDIFNNEYTYFSSYSKSWLQHAKKYVDYMTQRFGFNGDTVVIEIASNDGYLLQYFKNNGVNVLGIEPTANTANVAIDKGIDCIVDFFSTELANNKLANSADLILGNNVLAHVPDINDFVAGLKIALKKKGVITFEFPHLIKLISERQFDTIYHEHFSYLSLTVVNQIFLKHGLEIFDVQELVTHGGSIRIFAKNIEDKTKTIQESVNQMLKKEEFLGVKNLKYYKDFQIKVDEIKYNFLQFLYDQKKMNKKVIGYGAAAKGNTLLNYSGIKGDDLIKFVVDASPYKQGKLMPGSRIIVVAPESIEKEKPDFVIIFPWNLKEELMNELAYIRNWGGKFVTFIPEINIF